MNYFSFISDETYYKHAMGLVWVPNWDPHWTMSLCVIFRTSGQKIVRLSLHLLCIKHIQTTHFYYFVQQNIQKNLKSVLRSNTKTLPFHLKLNKTVDCHFQTLKQREQQVFFASVYRKTTFSGAFTNFESIISKSYKRTLIDTLLNKRFRKNHRKTLVWRLFRLATLLKSDSNTVVFL